MPALPAISCLQGASSGWLANPLWQTDALQSALVYLFLSTSTEAQLESSRRAVLRAEHARTVVSGSAMGLAHVLWPDRWAPLGSLADGASTEYLNRLSSRSSGGRAPRTGAGRRT